MLPDWPRLQRKAKNELLRFLKEEQLRQFPLQAQVSRRTLHEGEADEIHREDGSIARIEPKLHEAVFTAHKDEFKRRNPELLLTMMTEMAKSFGQQFDRRMLSQVSETAEEIGNTVNAGGGPLLQEHYLEMLDKVLIDFDPATSQPRMPTLVVHPDHAVKMRETLASWENDETFRLRVSEVIEKKRAEWRDRENHRRLVD